MKQLLLNPQEAKDLDAIHHVQPAHFGDNPEPVTVTDSTGFGLTGWLFSHENDYGTVLVVGGNGTSLGDAYAYNRFLLDHGFRTVVFTHQGYGDNKGLPALDALIPEVQAFYDAMRARYPNEPIAYVGESLGALQGWCSAQSRVFSAMALESVLDPKSAPYRLIDAYVPAPLSYVLSVMAWPIEFAYSSQVPDELDAFRCAQGDRVTETLFLSQQSDPVAVYSTVQALVRLRPASSALVTLPPAPYNHLELDKNPDAQDRVVRFLKQHLDVRQTRN